MTEFAKPATEGLREIVLGFLSGNEISETDREQYLEVIASALLVHLDRERVRMGLWKEYPAKDQMSQVRVKTDRVLRSLERGFEMTEDMKENAIEECYDIINYAIFTVRILTGRI